jgi:hypothetical protein
MGGVRPLARSLSERLPSGAVSTAPDDPAERGRGRWSLALSGTAPGDAGRRLGVVGAAEDPRDTP